MIADLKRAAEACRHEMAALLEALVAIPTENPPGRNYGACVRRIVAELERFGLDAQVIDVLLRAAGSEVRQCVLGSYGTGERTLYFHGHYDVVPASRDGQFEPRWEGDALYGRGAADMKGGLVAMIYAVNLLATCGVHLNGRIGLAIVPDEETGGRYGTGYLAASGLLASWGIGMLTPEPTGGVVWHASRGALSLVVRVKGRTAHVGLQHEGINAFERMVDVVQRLRALKAEVEQRVTTHAMTPEPARRSILLLGGRTDGGTGFNAVPAECRFTVDRRINPEEDLEVERRRVFDVFDEARRTGIDLEVEVLQEGLSTSVSRDHAISIALADSVAAVTGKPPTFGMCPGLLETRFYAARGVPALAYGPGGLDVSHGPNEFVRMERVLDCAVAYALTAARLLGA